MRNWIICVKYLYKEFIAYNLVFTLIGADLLIKYGARSYVYIVWIKIVGFAFIGIIYYWNRRKYLYFFYNLHINRSDLIISSLCIDIFQSVMFLGTINWLFS